MVNVITRHFFDYPLVWSDEASLYIFAWLVFFAGSLCTLSGKHVYVEAIRDNVGKIHGVLKLIWDSVIEIIIVIFLCILTYYTVILVKTSSIDISATLGLPRSWVYTGVLIGTIFSVINQVRVIVGRFASYGKEEKA